MSRSRLVTLPVLEVRKMRAPCRACGGSRWCSTCHGDAAVGTGKDMRTCPACIGGRCKRCGGTGWEVTG